MRETEPVRVLGQDVFRTHRIKHGFEILHEIERITNTVPVRLQAVGGRPMGGETHVMSPGRAAIAHEFRVGQVVEVLADEFFRRVVLCFRVVERNAMAEFAELFGSTVDVAMPARTGRGLRNDPGDVEAIEIAGTVIRRVDDRVVDVHNSRGARLDRKPGNEAGRGGAPHLGAKFPVDHEPVEGRKPLGWRRRDEAVLAVRDALPIAIGRRDDGRHADERGLENLQLAFAGGERVIEFQRGDIDVDRRQLAQHVQWRHKPLADDSALQAGEISRQFQRADDQEFDLGCSCITRAIAPAASRKSLLCVADPEK